MNNQNDKPNNIRKYANHREDSSALLGDTTWFISCLALRDGVLVERWCSRHLRDVVLRV